MTVLAPADTTPTTAPTPVEFRNEVAYWKILTATVDHYIQFGRRLRPERFKPYLDSSFRVAEYVKDWPVPDRTQRAMRYFGYGAAECGFHRDYYNVNVPGQVVRVPHKVTIKTFSIDYGWTGICHQRAFSNTEWAYQVALALQTGQFTPALEKSLHPVALARLKRSVHIPPTLKLKKIDVSGFKAAEAEWKWQKSQGVSPYKMKFDIKYRERTPDDIDSVLLYRIIIDIDRQARGWPWGQWKQSFLEELKKAVK